MNAQLLYDEAFRLWCELFTLEGEALQDPAFTCAEAWRLRRICERAHLRLMRRAERLKRSKANRRKRAKARKIKR
jgi:hypothetical protein